MRSRVLVTAAAGNVGREVTRECVERGLTVRVAGRSEAELQARFPGLEATELDFLDRTTWARALAGCDAVFLLRPPPLGDMDATLNPFVDAAYAAGIGHLVFLSVAGAERRQWVPHRKVELHLESTGRDWTVLRPGFFAQNLQDAYRRDILEDGRLYVPAADGRVAFLDVRDAAEVAARIFEAPGAFRQQALTLTGPEALTFARVAELLSRTLGRTIRYEPASVAGYVWHLRARREMSWMQVMVQTVLHVGLRRGDAEGISPTVEQLLGRAPRSLADYLAREADGWRR
jgi:uncharacterized protein YbjT (DUF2867 family)